MKPVACGNQVYSTGRFSSAATMSPRCAYARSDATAPSTSSATSKPEWLLPVTEASLLMRFRGSWLFSPLGRAPARQYAVRARLQVDVDVLDVARDVGIVPQRRHL